MTLPSADDLLERISVPIPGEDVVELVELPCIIFTKQRSCVILNFRVGILTREQLRERLDRGLHDITMEGRQGHDLVLQLAPVLRRGRNGQLKASKAVTNQGGVQLALWFDVPAFPSSEVSVSLTGLPCGVPDSIDLGVMRIYSNSGSRVDQETAYLAAVSDRLRPQQIDARQRALKKLTIRQHQRKRTVAECNESPFSAVVQQPAAGHTCYVTTGQAKRMRIADSSPASSQQALATHTHLLSFSYDEVCQLTLSGGTNPALPQRHEPEAIAVEAPLLPTEPGPFVIDRELALKLEAAYHLVDDYLYT